MATMLYFLPLPRATCAIIFHAVDATAALRRHASLMPPRHYAILRHFIAAAHYATSAACFALCRRHFDACHYFFSLFSPLDYALPFALFRCYCRHDTKYLISMLIFSLPISSLLRQICLTLASFAILARGAMRTPLRL